MRRPGTAIAAMMPMNATTISSSINAALRLIRRSLVVLAAVTCLWIPSLEAKGASKRSQDRIAELLMRTIRDAGESCDHVVTTFIQGSRARLGTFWNVECANGRTYAVRVTQGGETQVLTCEELRLTAATNCFVRFSR